MPMIARLPGAIDLNSSSMNPSKASSLVSLAMIGVAFLLTRGLTRPLTALTDAATRVTAGDLTVRMEVVVPPQEALEIRRIALTNHTDRVRNVTLTSYGEVVLAPLDEDETADALARGVAVAREFQQRGLIIAATLGLNDRVERVDPVTLIDRKPAHA